MTTREHRQVHRTNARGGSEPHDGADGDDARTGGVNMAKEFSTDAEVEFEIARLLSETR